MKHRLTVTSVRCIPFLVVALLGVALLLPLTSAPVQAEPANHSYTNPLPITIPSGGRVTTCADPTVIRSQTGGDNHWYMYCTTDPLSDTDRITPTGPFNFHFIPMFRSLDLVNWTYMGDVSASRPDWVGNDAGLWAPDIHFDNGIYYLYYTASNTDVGGSAIGVFTSTTPLGPWNELGRPVVEPHAPPCCPGDRRWTFDPDVIEVGGQTYLFYGSYFGGISARVLSSDLLSATVSSQVQIARANRYEGAHILERDGYFYLFLSATDCCRGPLTGYSVFVGRSQNILGPYVDRDGVSLLDVRVGGTPVLSMNGNRWVGMGHNTTFTDFEGQDWFIYHAVDRNDPYFANATGFTKRPALLDPLDWANGWPSVRAGNWASDMEMPAPAAQPGHTSAYVPMWRQDPQPGAFQSIPSDEFTDPLGSRWTWVRAPMTGTVTVMSGTLRFPTQDADLFEGSNNASVLTTPAPTGDYIVETRVRLDVPLSPDCCYNYRQAGILIYANDDNYVKLSHVSIWDTRQTEFAKEQGPVASGFPRYGNTVVSAPDEWTYLRIVRTEQPPVGIAQAEVGMEYYTAYVSRDGQMWNRGGTWAHDLNDNVRIGLVSMGGAGSLAEFDYVRVWGIGQATAIRLDSLQGTSTAAPWLLAALMGLLMAAGLIRWRVTR